MPDLDMALPILFDIGRHPERKMAAIKPEVEITFKRKDMAIRFQRLPPYLKRHFRYPKEAFIFVISEIIFEVSESIKFFFAYQK